MLVTGTDRFNIFPMQKEMVLTCETNNKTRLLKTVYIAREAAKRGNQHIKLVSDYIQITLYRDLKHKLCLQGTKNQFFKDNNTTVVSHSYGKI